MPGPLEVTDPAEGSVDWKGAKAYMMGEQGDEAGEDSETEAPQPREFKYRGKTVKVDADTYEVLEGLRKEARGANGRLGSELARTRERLAKLEGAFSARPTETRSEPDIERPDPLLATRDIAAWQRQYDAFHDAKMARQKAELEEKYMAHIAEVKTRVDESQRQKEWADGFYSRYDHLDHQDIKPIVAQVYTEHKEEIDALGDDPESAYERLAELADGRLVRLTRVGKEESTPQRKNRPPRVESSAGPAPRSSETTPDRAFSAASWSARERLKMAGRTVKER